VLQGQDRLRSNLLKIYYKDAHAGEKGASGGAGIAPGDIDHIVASGDVYIVTPTQVVRGDEALYTSSNNTTIVTGNVVVTQGQNVATGRRLTVDQNTVHTYIDGDEKRVQLILYSDHKQQGK
jgi:lipopolysaccharide export system protein LptA